MEFAISSEVPKCFAEVDDPPHYIHHYRCSRPSVESVEFDKGIAHLCRQHANIARKRGGLSIVKHGHLKLKEQVKG